MAQMQVISEHQIRSFDIALFDDFITWIDRSEKTAKTYLTNLRQFAAWLSYEQITEPNRGDVIRYRDYLLQEHRCIQYDPDSITGWRYRTDAQGSPVMITCKPNTAALYLRSVSQFFSWLEANGIYPNIAANIHAPKISQGRRHSRDALQASEVYEIEQSILRNATESAQAAYTEELRHRAIEQGKRLHAMYLLAVTAGLRTIELSRANVKDLVTVRGQSWLYVWGKGHTEPDAKKAIAPEVAQIINDYLHSRADKVKGNAPLFVATGNRSKGKRLASTTISTMLKRAMQEAGYNSERLTAHSLRHTAGTAAMDITGDLYQVQRYMRHSNPATTEIYLHNDTDQQEAGIASDLYRYYQEAGKPN